jgi:hypothetical protein
VGFRYATDARAFCFAIAARDVRAVAVAVDVAVAVAVAVAVDVVPQGVIIAFVSVMDLVLFSVKFEASGNKTIFALLVFFGLHDACYFSLRFTRTRFRW